MRHLRRTLGSAKRQSRSRIACQRLANGVRLPKSGWVGIYHADDGEIDLQPGMEWLRGAGCSLALPTIRDGTMRFTDYPEDCRLVPADFGLLEPHPCSPVAPQDFILILAPLVAFSSAGHRLGRGGGYYDRYLRHEPRPAVIGIGYEFQRCEDFTVHAGDVPLDAVATETGIEWFTPPGRFSKEEA